jgi:hypothetical protein
VLAVPTTSVSDSSFFPFLDDLLFYHEHAGSAFLRYVGNEVADYTVSRPRRQ